MRYVNLNVLSAADTTSQNGSTISADQLVSASFQAYFGDSTAAGTFKLQASNDPAPEGNMALASGFQPTNWVDIPNASVSISSGASAVIVVPQTCFRWMRAVYTFTSGGSSTINVNMFALSI